MIGTGGVESCVVALSTYHDSELGFVGLPRFIELLKSLHDTEKCERGNSICIRCEYSSRVQRDSNSLPVYDVNTR